MHAAVEPGLLDEFRRKWGEACPELVVAVRFLDPARRLAHEALLYLMLELELAAFGLRDAEPALIKLQWWAGEIGRAGSGEASHPLTQTLARADGFAAIALDRWHALLAGALAQREAEPGATTEAVLAHYAALHAPLAQIEAELFAPLDAATLARARTLGCALRELARLADALAAGRLPLPLDLLARHRLARAGLLHAGATRTAAVRDWLRMLGAIAAGLPARGIGAAAAATLAADRWRIGCALRAAEPLAALPGLLSRVPLRVPWAAWRARGA